MHFYYNSPAAASTSYPSMHHATEVQRNLHYEWETAHEDASAYMMSEMHSSGDSSQGSASYGGLATPSGSRVHRVNSDGEGIVLQTSSGQQIMLCDGVVNFEQCLENGWASVLE